MSSAVALATLAELSRSISVKQLQYLWRIEKDVGYGVNDHLKTLVGGQEVDIPGVLSIFRNGAMIARAPFGWDGPSPRLKVLWRGRVLFTIGSPLGPKDPETGLHATARGTLRHDIICRHAEEIARRLGVPVARVYAVADLCLRDDITEDWNETKGQQFYKAVRTAGDAYRGFA